MYLIHPETIDNKTICLGSYFFVNCVFSNCRTIHTNVIELASALLEFLD